MKRILLLMLLPLVLFSCTAEMEPLSAVDESPSVFKATFEGCGAPATKVFADETRKMAWNADDRITIFNKTTYNYQYKFLGEDGATSGEFEKQPVSGFITGGNVDHYFAVYPYAKANKLNNSGVLTVTLPSEQTWKEHSFGIGANTMVAASDDDFLAFKNVGGYLSIRLLGENVTVSRLTLIGNNSEKIAGKAEVTITPGGTPTTKMADTATEQIDLVCDPPMELSTTKYTEFWFVIPPVTFTNGFSVDVLATSCQEIEDGEYEYIEYERVLSTYDEFTITRSQLDWMSPVLIDW